MPLLLYTIYSKETNMEIVKTIMTHREGLRQVISEYDAIKSIKNLVKLTNNDTSGTVMYQQQEEWESTFMFCFRLMANATTANLGTTKGIIVSVMHNILTGRKALEWAGTYTPNRRIQWEFRRDGEVDVFVTSGTGRKSEFITKVFEDVELIVWGGMTPAWLMPVDLHTGEAK